MRRWDFTSFLGFPLKISLPLNHHSLSRPLHSFCTQIVAGLLPCRGIYKHVWILQACHFPLVVVFIWKFGDMLQNAGITSAVTFCESTCYTVKLSTVSSGLKPLQESLVVSALSQLSCSSSGKPSSGIASSGMPSSAYSSPPIFVTAEYRSRILISWVTQLPNFPSPLP